MRAPIHPDLGVVLRALDAAGVPRSVQRRAFRVGNTTMMNWRVRFGIETHQPDTASPHPGETWRDRPDLGVRVSDAGRVASLKTGLLLRITKPSSARYGLPYVTVRTGTPQQTTMRVHKLVAETFGLAARERAAEPWTHEEQEALRTSATFPEAYAALPRRTPGSVKKKALAMGLTLKRTRAPQRPKAPARDDAWAPVRGSVPLLEPLWVQAEAAVPRGLPSDVRDDLISDLVVMALEGFEGTMAEAFRLARKRRNAAFGTFKERSAFDCIPGTTIRLIDTFEQGQGL